MVPITYDTSFYAGVVLSLIIVAALIKLRGGGPPAYR
jgi:hypothetical protein